MGPSWFRCSAWVVLAGCAGSEAPVEPVTLEVDGRCAEAAERLGFAPCAHRVADTATWQALGVPGGDAQVIRATKYVVAVDPADELGVLFARASRFPLHTELLAAVSPARFPNLDAASWTALATGDDRELWSGVVAERIVDGAVRYTFTVWDLDVHGATGLDELDVLAVARRLGAAFDLGPLAFEPSSPGQEQAVGGWTGAVDVVLPDDGAVVAYVPGEAVGYVRLFDAAGLAAAERVADVGHQDIVVVDVAPADLQRPVAGLITGTRQAALSHLAVRSAARGTPDCFVPDARSVLAPHVDALVRITCRDGSLVTERVDPDEAAAHWASIRPATPELPTPDLEWDRIEALEEVDLEDLPARRAALRRYGAKGAWLAQLYRHVPDDLQLEGLLVPFRAGAEHLASHGWRVDVGRGLEALSFADTLAAWFADPAFLTDPRIRRERVLALRAAVAWTPPDDEQVRPIVERIAEVLGATTGVRLRSSSNAEDALGFNGAGLYASVAACAADDLDDDDHGPSRCDPSEPDEQTVAAALAEVWASTWSPPAVEERLWYGLDPASVAMGVLVNERSRSELATVVAFSGLPGVPGDDRVLIEAQLGDLEVVSAEGGLVPERLIVDVDVAPPVVVRLSPSNAVAPGQQVLDDGTALRIARTLRELGERVDFDVPVSAKVEPLLDTEWKVLRDGRLVVKQIRPFSRPVE